MIVLGLETSCDETAAALVKDGTEVISSIVSSQADLHGPYGGVVPELASRQHLTNILPILETALDQAGMDLHQVDGLAVTASPGLVGALLVGLSLTKALALALDKPFAAVDHLKAHVAAAFLKPLVPCLPALALVVSGGHTSLYRVEGWPDGFSLLGQTLDDAAGEAFDKVGKLLGLAYPAGAVIDRLAAQGQDRLGFPRPMMDDGSLNFSFSGLKTAVLNFTRTNPVQTPGQPAGEDEVLLADVCASFQEAVVEVLTTKTLAAARSQGVGQVILAGGVAANQRLRSHLDQALAEKGIELLVPEPSLCTDNAAMVAAAGYYELKAGRMADWSTDALSRPAPTAGIDPR
ncbi:MAG: tRNA (adenosine(37)-N6)-threonylcarbamoyltransferase complex transferase subunit TsaD [Deltaproteobacteria bacterium]|nr:tRNA (adenosine(37)-N6)-threonylcarbamoyltransferase complex transferase subunit TsaD [Deltaproteobacteria bacterium]